MTTKLYLRDTPFRGLEGLDEYRARQALYGPLSGRSEDVRLVDDSEWIGHWPRVPDCAGRRNVSTDFPPVVFHDGDRFSVLVDIGPFGATVRPGVKVTRA